MDSNKKYASGLAAGFLVLMALGCSTEPKSDENESYQNDSYKIISKSQSRDTASAETKESPFFEIEFEQGSADLTTSSKLILEDILTRSAGSKAKKAELIVMAWPDEELPGDNLVILEQNQKGLAEDRTKRVREYCNEIGKAKVDTYNMALQPHIVSEWFNTTDNKLKYSLMKAGLPTSAGDLQYESKASRAVILFKTQ